MLQANFMAVMFYI